MNQKLRDSGIDIIGDVTWGAHFCLFYQTKKDLMDILVPYFKTGLENNEFCIWITSQSSEVEEAKEAMRKTLPDFDTYAEKGQIEIDPYTQEYVNEDGFNPEKVISSLTEKLNKALAIGYSGLRVTGDTSWLRKEGWYNFVSYEEEVDRIIENYQVIALCTYCLDRCNATEIIDVVSNHQFALIKREGQWEKIESSKRKKAEEEALQATKNWEYTFDAVPDPIAILDNKYRVVRANRAMASRLGVTPEECVGAVCYRAIHGTDRPPSFCPHRQLLRDKHEHIREVREDSLGGDFIVSVSPLFNSEGKLTGCIHVARDINERKQAEKELIRRENEFRTLAENSPDRIARFDRQKRYTYVNPVAAEPFGRSPEEIIGRTNSELGMDPDKIKFWKEHYENVFTTIQPENIESQYISPEGKKYYFNTQIVPEFFDGEVTSILAISRDFTDIKEAENRLKETLDNSEKLVEERTAELEKAYNSLKESEKSLAEAQKMAHIGNWEWDIATDKAYWSEEMYRIFGRDPQELAPSYNEYLNYIHPHDQDYFKNAARKAISGKSYSIDHRIVLANGEVRAVHLQSEVIFDEKEIPKKIKGIVQDITERKKAEKALLDLEIIRKKEIHHRIKNNLQVISSLLDLQAENFRDRKYVEDSEVLNSFRESQNRIMSIALIHEELHEGGGDNTLNFSLYLEKLVKDLFQTYRVGNENVSLKIDLEENILFDMDTAVPLGIIVNELVSNSLEHAFPGRNKGEIRIKLFKEEKAENELESDNRKPTEKSTRYTLIVSDNGIGTPENIDIENSGTLGLQLVHILVNQLGGKIELKKGKGTEFKIRVNV